MKISVCMAAYNGAEHIRDQIASILHQLGLDDELIIVDDASTDETVKIIESFGDSKIRLHRNKTNLGPSQTFNKALSIAEGDLVFLSDQDDVWYDDKVATIRCLFESSDLDLVVHDARVISGDRVINESLFEMCRSSPSLIRNIVSSTHTGCCMALRNAALKVLLPIPFGKGIYHDAWIGVLSSCLRQKKLFLHVPLIDYQRHGGNVSTMRRRSLIKIVPERFNLIRALVTRLVSGIIKRGK